MTTTTAVLPERRTQSRAANVALWVLQAVLAFMFLGAGYSKLSGDPMMVSMFEAIGLGQWFRYLTGALEVGGALLLLVPATAALGGLLLAGVMAGAVATHLFVVGGSPAMAGMLLVFSLVVAYGRRERLRALLGR